KESETNGFPLFRLSGIGLCRYLLSAALKNKGATPAGTRSGQASKADSSTAAEGCDATKAHSNTKAG
ncbi:MAG: hypothetical protein J7539_08870, partial [Niabella sp.]|nr:hypothetical protein [Niabella sp.]